MVLRTLLDVAGVVHHQRCQPASHATPASQPASHATPASQPVTQRQPASQPRNATPASQPRNAGHVLDVEAVVPLRRPHEAACVGPASYSHHGACLLGVDAVKRAGYSAV